KSRIRLHSVIGVSLMAVAMVVIAVSASAQSLPLVAQIPFAFHAGESTMPSGEYTISLVSPFVVKIANTATHESTFLMTNGVSESKPGSTVARITFNQYGTEYFVSNLFWPGYDTGRSVIKSGLEARLSKIRPPVRIDSVATTQ